MCPHKPLFNLSYTFAPPLTSTMSSSTLCVQQITLTIGTYPNVHCPHLHRSVRCLLLYIHCRMQDGSYTIAIVTNGQSTLAPLKWRDSTQTYTLHTRWFTHVCVEVVDIVYREHYCRRRPFSRVFNWCLGRADCGESKKNIIRTLAPSRESARAHT